MDEKERKEGLEAIAVFAEENEKVDRDREIMTREWLLGSIEHKAPVPMRGKKVYIRVRISAEEQATFPTIYKIFTDPSNEYQASEEENKAIETELPKFISMLLMEPKVEPKDINSSFTEVEKTRIIKHFFVNLLMEASNEAIQFFRQDGRGPGDDEDMAGDGPESTGPGEDATVEPP